MYLVEVTQQSNSVNNARKFNTNFESRMSAEVPRVLPSVSIDDFVKAIEDTSDRGGRPAILLFMCREGAAGATRNVACAHAVSCTTNIPDSFVLPRKGTETYVTAREGFQTGLGGRPHSENKGMCDDWAGNRVAMNSLLADPDARRIFTLAFGENFRILPERGNYRSEQVNKDLKKTPEKLTVHKDVPVWERSKTTKVEIVTATCQVGELGWVLIDQSEFHGIPSGGDCVGWFVEAVSRDGFSAYLLQVESHLRRLRQGYIKPINHDPEAHQEGFSALDAIMYDFCKGSRPHLYGSGKTVQAPHSMAARFFPFRQHRYLTREAFSRVHNITPCDGNDAAMDRLRDRGLAYAFSKVSRAGEWNVDPSTYSDDALLRFFGIAPRKDQDAQEKKPSNPKKRKRRED